MSSPQARPNPDPWAGPASPAHWTSPVSLIRLEGPDSKRFLHGQSSQAIEMAAPGACLATCLITPTARLRGLALALVDGTGLDLVVLEGEGAAIHQALDRVLFPADRVRLDAPQPASLVRLAGPLPPGLISGASGQWQPLPEGAGLLLQPEVSLGGTAGSPALLLRSGDERPAWLDDLTPLDPAAWEQWRLGQGFPASPGELNDGCNPFELGLAGWVSLSKGCYVGQETLAKLATYDGVKQQLRRWFWRGTQDPGEPGTVLFGAKTGDETSSPRAGLITSSLALEDGFWIGLALVRRQSLQQTCLRAGPDADGALLELSRPPTCVDPPVGAGRKS